MRYDPRHAVVRAVKSLPRRAKFATPVAAVLALAGGSAVMAAGAGAATNACNSNCVDISFLSTGHHWLLNDSKGSHAINATVSQQRGSNGGNQGRNEDFRKTQQGTVVPTYCPSGSTPATYPGLFTSAQCTALVNAGLSGATAYQLEYYPYGGDASGLCVSAWDGQDPVPSGYKARFQTCGVNADSVLIDTTTLDGGSATGGGHWVISGGSSNFSQPVVLSNNGLQEWQNVTWQTVQIDGGSGVVNQEVLATSGPFV